MEGEESERRLDGSLPVREEVQEREWGEVPGGAVGRGESGVGGEIRKGEGGEPGREKGVPGKRKVPGRGKKGGARQRENREMPGKGRGEGNARRGGGR